MTIYLKLRTEEAIKNSKYKIDILGLALIKRKDETTFKMKQGNQILVPGYRGVVFVINKACGEKLLEYKGTNDRIAMVKLKISKNKLLLFFNSMLPNCSVM